MCVCGCGECLKLYTIVCVLSSAVAFHDVVDPVDVGAHLGVHRAAVGGTVESAEARNAEQEPLLLLGIAEAALAHERTAAVALARVGLDAARSSRTYHRLRIVQAERERLDAYLVLFDGHLALLDALNLLVVVLVRGSVTSNVAYL